MPSPSVSLKEAASEVPKRKQVTLSTEKKSVQRKSVVRNEEDEDNIEEEEALAVPEIKPIKQKYTKKQPVASRVGLRKRESGKKEEKVWKCLLPGQNGSKCKRIEEYRHFDHTISTEESDNGCLDKGRVLEGSKCAACSSLEVLSDVEWKD